MWKNGEFRCDGCGESLGKILSEIPLVMGTSKRDERHFCDGQCYRVSLGKDLLSKICPQCHQTMLEGHPERRGWVKCPVCGFACEESSLRGFHEDCFSRF